MHEYFKNKKKKLKTCKQQQQIGFLGFFFLVVFVSLLLESPDIPPVKYSPEGRLCIYLRNSKSHYTPKYNKEYHIQVKCPTFGQEKGKSLVSPFGYYYLQKVFSMKNITVCVIRFAIFMAFPSLPSKGRNIKDIGQIPML